MVFVKKLQKIWRSLKAELFYARKMISQGYGPVDWYNYIKNRFLGNYFFKYLPRHDYETDPDLELHTIASPKYLWMFGWMMRSFLFHSGLRPMVVIHEDGTMDKKTEDLIKSKFPNTKIMYRGETTPRMLLMPEVPEIIKKAKTSGHFFIDKLLNAVVFSRAKKLIVTDVDILFYKKPQEVIDFVNGKTTRDALVSRSRTEGHGGLFKIKMDDFYTQKYNLENNPIGYMNGGYFVINKEKATLDKLVECFEHLGVPFTDYFIETIGWQCMLIQMNYGFLPEDIYKVKGRVDDRTVMKHFTSPRRHEMFAYGFDLARARLPIQ